MLSEVLEIRCKAALNRVHGMHFEWSLNPYTGCAHRCTFCYVRGFERRADRPSDHRYGQVVRAKTNIAEALRAELSRPSWKRDAVVVGPATDPYQPAEGRYRLTRACLEALAARRNPFSVLTRGTMIVRDLDVLVEAAGRAEVDVTFSLPTLDPEIWRRTEPGTPPPRQRLRALSRLVAAGVNAGVGLAPLLPGLSDRPEQIAAVVRAARHAGATHLWGSLLNLRPGTREHFLACLARDWPEQLPRYERLFAGRSFLPASAARALGDQLARVRRRYPLREETRIEPPREAEQLALRV
ncbi:MAG TPA: radical SAM protein [Terriglobales bacterium]|nr:radical SAM protein [Terriglobales bacterium]